MTGAFGPAYEAIGLNLDSINAVEVLQNGSVTYTPAFVEAPDMIKDKQIDVVGKLFGGAQL